MQVLLNLAEVCEPFIIDVGGANEESNHFVARDLNADANRWPEPEILNVLSIQGFELCHIGDE